ncbi:GNAT family N-acetyltransferase [Halomonas sp. McH1-25]|uniref:GNAT family N-acetyltransferase n=2 Tax=Halomonas TaxID=2745 RepID=UPI001EF53710|nr:MULTISPECIES: GNAT family protein [unclassified Halomonas]MCG7599832.1 GNAT family N-acetyltransferase [Halomonas sp. McH1-25]MCP1341727.1 GNAT family N-acetyltransferase [Halomonas sp. FL8]
MTATINAFGQPVGHTVPDWQPPSLPGETLLQGRYCRLESLSAERHGDALWAAWRQPDPTIPADTQGEARWTYLGGRPFADAAGCHAWLRQCGAGHDPRFMAVIEAASGDALGAAAWLNIQPAHGSVELGHLSFSPRLARTPAATEALVLMMRHVFDLGFRRLEWKCDALNAPSRRAAQRLGLRFEGIFHQHRVVNGRNRDSAWYSLLNHEWRQLMPVFERWLSPANFDAHGRQHQALSALTAAALAPRPDPV